MQRSDPGREGDRVSDVGAGGEELKKAVEEGERRRQKWARSDQMQRGKKEKIYKKTTHSPHHLDDLGLSGMRHVDKRRPAPVVAPLEELGGAHGGGDVGSPVAASESTFRKFQCLRKCGGVAGFRGG